LSTTLDVAAEAAALAAEFRADAAERDLEVGTPWAQRQRIRDSGLLRLIIPPEYGGLGSGWPTGAQGSDLLLVSATEPGDPRPQVVVLPTKREGVVINDDWANMGQRQTDRGSVSFSKCVGVRG